MTPRKAALLTAGTARYLTTQRHTPRKAGTPHILLAGRANQLGRRHISVQLTPTPHMRMYFHDIFML